MTTLVDSPPGDNGSFKPDKQPEHPGTAGAHALEGAVAVIGMSGLFPGSPTLGQFWEHIQAGRIFNGDVPPDRFDGRAFLGDPLTEGNRSYTLRGSYLDRIDAFDAEFFQISPREAARMDPQQRLLLQLSWAALEDAGYRPSQWKGTSLGVFVGGGVCEYADRLKTAAGLELADLFPCLLPNRISQFLDVHGPSELTSAACAGSLLAVHRAVLALRNGECEAALAGGINLVVAPDVSIGSARAGVLSRDGSSETFIRNGQGWRRGEGAGLVLLKPLVQALADRDRIAAVIRGTAVNHAGAASSLLAPNFPVQVHAVMQAYQRAGVSPETVTLLVAQGTGNEVADALELKALEFAFNQLAPGWAERAQRCTVACLKPNFGHLESASGIASLLLAILALRHRSVPGVAGLTHLSPRLDGDGSPFRLSATPLPWEASADERGSSLPRRASVHNFGYGGTTAHLVLEEHVAPAAERSEASGPHLVLLSARGEDRLRAAAQDLRDHLRENAAGVSLADLAWTLQVGREAFEHRLAIVTQSLEELKQQLDDFLAGKAAIDNVFQATVSTTPARSAAFGQQEEDRIYVTALGRAGKWLTLADLWLRGLSIPWEAIPEGRRVSLPTYPFAETRHWLTGEAHATQGHGSAAPPEAITERPTRASAFIELLRRVLGMPPGPVEGPDPLEERLPRTLGLDSLRALELLGRLERSLGVTLPLQRVMGAATVRQLANELVAVADALPPLVPDAEGRFTPFPLTDIQLAYLLGRGKEVPLGGNSCHLYWEWESPGWDVLRLERAWNDLIARHDMLRAVVRPDGRQQVLADVPAYRFEIGDVRAGSPAQVAAHLEELRARLSHECRPTDQWPLFHVAVSLLPGAMRLHLSLDLLIADARSIIQLLREWAASYTHIDRVMPDPAVQFRDYVRYLEQVRQHPRYHRAAAYWEARRDELPPAPELPWLRDPASVRTPSYRRLEVRLLKEVWDRLRTALRARGLTANAGLVTAFAEVLSRWSHSPRFTINLTVSQRLPVHPDIDGLIGDFTSTLLLGLDLAQPRSFAARTMEVQNQVTEHLEHALVSGPRSWDNSHASEAGRSSCLWCSPVCWDTAKQALPKALSPCWGSSFRV